MSKPVDPADLAKLIVYKFRSYTEQVSKDIDKAVEYCTEYAKREIEKHSPESGNSSSGSYKKGWLCDVRKGDTRSFGMVKHNYPKNKIVHLLELGHKARNYEKNNKMVAPVPHVNDNEDLARSKLDEMINTILSTTK